MNIGGREMCALLPALCALMPGFSSGNENLKSAAYSFDGMPVDKDGPATYRDILEGRKKVRC